MNPFDKIGQPFSLSLYNPNPKARRRKDGPRYFVEFEIDAETFDLLMSCRELSGLVLEADCTVTAINEPITPAAPAPPAPGKRATDITTERVGTSVAASAPARVQSYAQNLHTLRYWHNSRLWAAMEAMKIYTQREHQAWIEKQPCHGIVFFKRKTFDRHVCRGDVVAHHTPSAALPAAGKGSDNPRKPPHWWTVPACAEFHDWCHGSHGANRDDKQRLVEDGAGFTAERIEQAMKTYIGLADGEHLIEDQVFAFEREIGLK